MPESWAVKGGGRNGANSVVERRWDRGSKRPRELIECLGREGNRAQSRRRCGVVSGALVWMEEKIVSVAFMGMVIVWIMTPPSILRCHPSSPVRNTSVISLCLPTVTPKRAYVPRFRLRKGEELISVSANNQTIYHCAVLECTKTFTKKYSVRRHCALHFKTSHLFNCSRCGIQFKTWRTFSNHLRKHGDLKVGSSPRDPKCGTCKLSFPNLSLLLKHRQEHSQCQICRKTFASEQDFDEHLEMHRKGVLFCCPICRKSFRKNSSLEKHISSGKHTAVFLPGCTECGMEFRTRSSLIRHMDIHTGHREFKCPTCSRAFRWRQNLKIHLLTHTNTRFTCWVCPLKYRQKYLLDHHLIAAHGFERETVHRYSRIFNPNVSAY